MVQVVGRRTDIQLLDEWADQEPVTQIVAIANDQINDATLRAGFEACLQDSAKHQG